MKNQEKTSRLQDKQRRHLLIGLGSIVGASVANELLGGNAFSIAMAYAESEKQPAKVLSHSQLVALKAICQTVIPATDTAGAGDVDTHGFIDNQLHHCFDEDSQASIVAVVDLIEATSRARHKARFSELSLINANSLLNDIDTAKNDFTKDHTSSFKFLKSLIVFGYYTSEVGASKELRYDAVPGDFTSTPLEEIGSQWGSRAYF